VSALTLQVLFDANADAMSTKAQAWLALAEALDNATEDLIHGSRDLEHVWPMGPAAEAARQKSAALRAEASNAYQPCKRIGDALRQHADTVRHLQNLLKDITAEATTAGFQVDIVAGTVVAPQHMYQSAGSGAYVVAQACSSYMWQLDGLLGQANDCDSRTVTVITANLPDAQRGFGSLSLPPVSDATLRSQHGRPPADVHAWWDSLTPEQQDQAIHDHPDLVGALDGVPAADRDAANRAVLDRDITDLNDRKQSLSARQEYILSMADQGRLEELYPGAGNPTGAALAELDHIKDQRSQIDGTLTGANTIKSRLADPNKPAAFLLGFSAADDGRAIVSVGNPDVAHNVVTYVPGTMSDLPSVSGDLQRADIMAADANRFDQSGRTTASVLWLGYDPPDMFNNAGSGSYAEHATHDLQNFESGLRATHDGQASHNTIIGHSYGTTTVGYAAREGNGLAVNDVIFVGSPGVGVDTASDLHIQGTASNVWASTAANDVIRFTGFEDTMRFGENPDNPGFGGRQFTSAPGSWNPVATHSEYWDPHNPSRDNIANIIIGQKDRVH
jgi:hypothetical protein